MFSKALPHVEVQLRALELLPPDQIARLAEEDAYFRILAYSNKELTQLQKASRLARRGLYSPQYSTRPYFDAVGAEPELVAFSEDKRVFVTASTTYAGHGEANDEIRIDLFNAATGVAERGHVVQIPPASELHALAASHDSKTVALATKSGNEARVSLVDTNSGETLHQTLFEGTPVKNCFSPDGLDALYTNGNKLTRINVLTGCKTSMIGHDEPVVAAAFSPDQLLVASGSRDGTVRIWAKEGGRLLRTLRLKSPLETEQNVLAVAFAPDNIHVAAVYPIGMIRIWNLLTQEVVRSLEWAAPYEHFGPERPELRDVHRHASDLPIVTFSPNGASLALDAGKGRLQFFDPFPGNDVVAGPIAEHVSRFNPAHYSAFAFSSYGEIAWIASADSLHFTSVQLLKAEPFPHRPDPALLLKKGEGNSYQLLAGGGPEIVSFAFSPPGLLLAAATNSKITILNATTGELVREINLATPTDNNQVAFSSDETRIAVFSGQSSGRGAAVVHHFDALSGHLLRSVTLSHNVRSHTVSLGEKLNMAGIDGRNWLVRIDAGGGAITARSPVNIEHYLPGANSPVIQSPDGRFVALPDAKQNIQVINEQGKAIYIASPDDSPTTLPRVTQFTRDGNHVAIGHDGDSGKLVSTVLGRQICQFTTPAHQALRAVAIARRSVHEVVEIAASSAGNSIYFWDENCRPLGTLHVNAPSDGEPNAARLSLAYSPDGQHIALLRPDGFFVTPRQRLDAPDALEVRVAASAAKTEVVGRHRGR